MIYAQLLPPSGGHWLLLFSVCKIIYSIRTVYLYKRIPNCMCESPETPETQTAFYGCRHLFEYLSKNNIERPLFTTIRNIIYSIAQSSISTLSTIDINAIRTELLVTQQHKISVTGELVGLRRSLHLAKQIIQKSIPFDPFPFDLSQYL